MLKVFVGWDAREIPAYQVCVASMLAGSSAALDIQPLIEPHLRAERGKNMDFKYYPVGQLVGMMKHETSVKQVIYDMINEYIETVESLAASLDLAE